MFKLLFSLSLSIGKRSNLAAAPQPPSPLPGFYGPDQRFILHLKGINRSIRSQMFLKISQIS